MLQLLPISKLYINKRSYTKPIEKELDSTSIVKKFDFSLLGSKKAEVKPAVKASTIVSIYICLSRNPDKNINNNYLSYINALIWQKWLDHTLAMYPQIDICRIYYVTSFGNIIIGQTKEQRESLQKLVDALVPFSKAMVDYTSTSQKSNKKLSILYTSLSSRINALSRNRIEHDATKDPILNKHNFQEATKILIGNSSFKLECFQFNHGSPLPTKEDDAHFYNCTHKELSEAKVQIALQNPSTPVSTDKSDSKEPTKDSKSKKIKAKPISKSDSPT